MNIKLKVLFFLFYFNFSDWQQAMEPFFSTKSLNDIKEKVKMVATKSPQPNKRKTTKEKEKKGAKRTKK